MAEALAVAVTGEAMPAGVNIDRVPAPHRTSAALAATEQATTPDNLQAGSDARSETGAGVGLASQRIPVSGRGRIVALGGIALAALVVGFVATRLMSHPAEVPTAASTTAAAASTSLAAAIPSAVLLPPLPSATTLPADTASAAASVHPPTPLTAPPAGMGKGRPHPSATASAPPVATPVPAAPTPTVVKPPAGSDDDIK